MITISESYTVGAGVTHEATDGNPVFLSVDSPSSTTGDFLNLGTIRGISQLHPAGIVYQDNNGPRGDTILDNRGIIEVIAASGAPMGQGNAYGVFVESLGPAFLLNSGRISATAHQFAHAVRDFGKLNVQNGSTGIIEATSTGGFDAFAIRLDNGGDVTNDGLIQATGDGFVYGVWIEHFENSPMSAWDEPHRIGVIENNGTIIAQSNGSGLFAHSYGISVLAGWDWTQGLAPNIINHGEITAEFSIYVRADVTTNKPGIEYVYNDGVLNGHIRLWSGDDKIVNDGEINGNIDLGEGNDVLDSRLGVIDGELINGGDGDDTIWSGAGNDKIEGGFGFDTIDAGAGDDIVYGSKVDALEGGDGFDTLICPFGAMRVDLVQGVITATNEVLVTVSGFERIEASSGNDTLIGNSANNELIGYEGDDILEGGLGADVLDGWTGLDTVAYTSSNAAVVVNLALLTASGGHATGDTLIAIENAAGSSFADTLTGSSAANRLDGAQGADLIFAGGGDDFVLGDEGNDVLIGEGGNDALSGWNGFDWMEGGDGADWLAAGAGDDRLEGGAGSDTLDGQAGWDTMYGGVGDDVYYVDDAGDDPRENSGEGYDIVFTSVTWAIRPNIEIVFLAPGAGGIIAFGDTAANVLVGNEVSNVIAAYGGNDWIEGRAGNDWLEGWEGDDRIEGGDGADRLDGGQGSDVLIGGANSDTFVYNAISDSSVASYDSIRDFQTGVDKVNLTAVRTGGADSFHFVYAYGNTYLFVDIAGGGDDMLIELQGSPGVTASDLIWS